MDINFLKKSFLFSKSETLLIIPPIATTTRPSLGVHVLQAYSKKVNYKINVLYANIIFAAQFGLDTNEKICNLPASELLGEGLFAATAYEVAPFGNDSVDMLLKHIELSSKLIDMEKKINDWIDKTASFVVECNFKVVGCTSMFEQTAASVALLKRIKQKSPDIITIIGGSNCDGVMAEGIASLTNKIDYIFSGESEDSFVNFLERVNSADKAFSKRIIYGKPKQDLDSIPPPDYTEYYRQFKCFFTAEFEKPNNISIMYETSRGCWRGQKTRTRCTFCGLNGGSIGFRQKSAIKVLNEIKLIAAAFPQRIKMINMSDNVMPNSYFKTLLPHLTDLTAEIPYLKIFYEQRPTLSLKQMIALRKAGVLIIQPGIEALSNSLLNRMNKGVTVSQNLRMLRYARSTGMAVNWNLLGNIPGDQKYEYDETLSLIQMLHHLYPPVNFFWARLERFSSYFEMPNNYGITNIRPLKRLRDILPEYADIEKIAYNFSSDYESIVQKDHSITKKIIHAVRVWRNKWNLNSEEKHSKNQPPVLEVRRENDGSFVLRDTRGISSFDEECRIDRKQAIAALTASFYEPALEIEWSVARKIGIIIDSNKYIPLATASPELISEFEHENRMAQ